MNFYSHHIGDFNNATRHLSRLERSIYRDLLELYYDTEKPLTADVDRLSRRCLIADDERAAMRDILGEFFELTDDGYRNKRADREIAAYQRMGEGGKRGAAKRWGKGADSPPIATPLPPQPKANANHEPLTSNHKNTKTPPPPDGVDTTVWQDFLKLRKAKKAPVTDTAIDGIRREADKAGLALGDALAMCCKRGWQGFDASWVTSQSAGAQIPGLM